MIRLLERLRGRASGLDAPPRYPPGARLYCVGDIHGRADLLVELHSMIAADAAGYQGDLHLLYIGDYIDRGVQSRQVVEMLINQPFEGFETIYLKGNHEQFLLDFLKFPEATAVWLLNGGRETMISYGVSPTFMPRMSEMPDLAATFRAALPDEHLEFLESGLLSWTAGDYHFVHAGIRPGVPLDRQHFEDQLWIREDFTRSDADHGKVVVHGHTIADEVEIRPNRIGIDTGAFHTGVLTCLVLEGEDRRLLQTGRGA